MNDQFERLLDKENEPNEETIAQYLGKRASTAWIKLRQFLEENYDFIPETVFYGKKYGWTIRYRKSRKTLCSLFPETGAFTVLIVLGKKETERATEIAENLSPEISRLIHETEQLRDGKWLWIRIRTSGVIDDVMKLIAIKRKPKKTGN